jgi:hypothetical protein
VDASCGVEAPSGGVGGLPVEGFREVLIMEESFSRGFRNISRCRYCRRHRLMPKCLEEIGKATTAVQPCLHSRS